jgi:hypothetical protein
MSAVSFQHPACFPPELFKDSTTSFIKQDLKAEGSLLFWRPKRSLFKDKTRCMGTVGGTPFVAFRKSVEPGSRIFAVALKIDKVWRGSIHIVKMDPSQNEGHPTGCGCETDLLDRMHSRFMPLVIQESISDSLQQSRKADS